MGKDRDTFDQEIRSEAETRIRQSLALDAFADAENITSASEESDSRERRALARLVEIATGDQRDGNEPPTPENSADRAETSDTERQASEAASPATTVAEEGRAQ
jgi:FKBP-type peptidyl-prolyl cis-trans isomerase (trigger factor)